MEYEYPKDLWADTLMLRLPSEMEVIFVGDTLNGGILSYGKVEDYIQGSAANGFAYETYPVVEMVFEIHRSRIVAKIVVSTCGD